MPSHGTEQPVYCDWSWARGAIFGATDPPVNLAVGDRNFGSRKHARSLVELPNKYFSGQEWDLLQNWLTLVPAEHTTCRFMPYATWVSPWPEVMPVGVLLNSGKS
jgi:hypothetical protein